MFEGVIPAREETVYGGHLDMGDPKAVFGEAFRLVGGAIFVIGGAIYLAYRA